ncbi:ABC transporter ATP-binding protein [Clostridium sp. WLY-B-L2]|uniref:ABC transporter ATP-binding protein n=1 Tax=Clostridium aromativorans TaxID=2836848 RepID=A0ABS8N0G2_9CLOT|nr:ABC transporter ATP-binding protein [Clostridium aromativorans]MCC9293290.1 ABC transporter ATP-binding protein [Clostridium aromativorans]
MPLIQKVLELKGVFKKRGKVQVLKDIAFSINAGEICGLVGKNGAGKTTLIKIITSMLFPDEGEILIEGKDLKTEREKALKNIGAIVEKPEFYGYMTGRQNLNYIAGMMESVTKDKIEDVIKYSKLGSKIDKKVKTYSLGMKQRLGLAQALMGRISLLILDEPTNGLDPIGVVELKNTIKILAEEKGVSVLISSHILSEIESICTKVVFIDEGKIVGVEKIGSNSKASSAKNMFIKTNLSEKASEIIKNIFDVKLLEVKNDGVSILINTESCDLFTVLKKLHDSGIIVEGCFEVKQNLEDKFIKMMGENGDE